jgi:hypothetical protein
MPIRGDSDDEFDDDWDANDPGDDEDATIPCPHCGQEIHEDAQRCPCCERYLSDADAPAAPVPWLIAVGVLLSLVAVYFWIFGPR